MRRQPLRGGRGAWMAALLLVLSTAAGARAQNPADVAAARDLFIEASKLGELGRWAEARDRYERSLSLKHAAVTLYSLGVAQTHLGQLVEALESFRAFLAEPPAPATNPYDGPARDAVRSLERRIARLDVVIEPAEAKAPVLQIDGLPVPAAALGQTRLVNPGLHVVAATAAGYRETRIEATLAEGEQSQVKLTLLPLPVVAPTATASPSPGPLAVDTASRSRALPIALIGGGAALFGAGIVMGLVAVDSTDRAPTRDGPAADGARSLALAGDIAGGTGLAVAVLGGIVLAVRPARAPAKGVALSPWIGPSSIGVRGRF